MEEKSKSRVTYGQCWKLDMKQHGERTHCIVPLLNIRNRITYECVHTKLSQQIETNETSCAHSPRFLPPTPKKEGKKKLQPFLQGCKFVNCFLLFFFSRRMRAENSAAQSEQVTVTKTKPYMKNPFAADESHLSVQIHGHGHEQILVFCYHNC